MAATDDRAADVRAAIDATPVWYHTLELAPGVVTPGYFDLRPIADSLPWPEVAGKRCLDIATFDGFYAFELERRGASEVVAIDVNGPEDFDWPPHLREWGVKAQKEFSPVHAAGFEVAHKALDSKVDRRRMTIYELSPEELGQFDVVTCGSLLLHLRDPLRALEAVRGVCGGQFMSVEEVDLPLTLLHRRQPVSRLDGRGSMMQWAVTNRAGHRQMIEASGFELEQISGLLTVERGVSHPEFSEALPARMSRWLARVPPGLPHQAVVARPAV